MLTKEQVSFVQFPFYLNDRFLFAFFYINYWSEQYTFYNNLWMGLIIYYSYHERLLKASKKATIINDYLTYYRTGRYAGQSKT